MQLNIVTAMNTDSTNIMHVHGGPTNFAINMPHGQSQRSGAIQTVRNNKGPNLNFAHQNMGHHGTVNQKNFGDKN